MSQQPSLYERIGGEKTLDGVVAAFYDRVFADPELAPFFAGVSRDKLQKMVREFLAVALDGPVQYTGRDLAAAHFGRGITPQHLAKFVGHLRATLSGSLSEKDTLDVISRVDLEADAVLGRTNVEG